jgi:transposase
LESSGYILLKFLQNNYPNGKYHACYEAGFCGFSVQRELTSLSIECIVVNACDIPQTQKGTLSKTDASDSKRIAEAFAKQMLKPIYVPDKISEADRNLIRYRKRTQELLKAKRQGIKSCLNILGISIPSQHDKPYWTNNFIKWLQELKIEEFSGKATVDGLVDDAIFFRKKLLLLNKEIKKLSISAKYKEMYDIITSTPGIGLITGMTMLTEVVDINRFQNFTKFNSFIGLCPSEFSSGERERKGKMTRRSNKQIRTLLIEAAWIAIRFDPALTLKYQELLVSKTKKRAIVIIARKLLSRIYKIWKTKEVYQNGIVK